MKTPALAAIYLDDASIGLMGDPRPRVAKIVAAGGKHPSMVNVVRTQSSSDQKGKALSMEDIIDRTVEPRQPIYLRSRPRAHPADLPEKPTLGSSAFVEFPSPEDGGPRPLGDPLPGDSFLRGGRRT